MSKDIMPDDNKISSIYQQGNEPGKEQGPPAHLDSTIRQAAHDVVKQDVTADIKQHAKSPFSGAWPALASIAAVLLITVILVPLINQEVPLPVASTSWNDKQDRLPLQEQVLERKAQVARVLEGQGLEEQIVEQKVQELQLHKQKIESHSKRFAKKTKKHALQTSAAAPVASAKTAATPTAAIAARSQREREVDHDTASTYEAEVTNESKEGQQLFGFSTLPNMQTKNSTALTPKKWLEKIRLLIDEGELVSARKELESFKAHYPDEKIDQLILREISQ